MSVDFAHEKITLSNPKQNSATKTHVGPSLSFQGSAILSANTSESDEFSNDQKRREGPD
jgi:hypothetical protein